MRPTTIDCPHCEAIHEFFLQDEDRHLRQCPTCDGWFVFSTDSDELQLKALTEPVTCPVSGCEETPESNALPEHIIAEHDAALD